MTKKLTKEEKRENQRKRLMQGFPVRLLDKESVDLVMEAMEHKLFPDRNKLINACIKGYLKVIIDKNNPEETLKSIFSEEMGKFTKNLQSDIDFIKESALITAAIQKIDGKAISFIINLALHFLNNQSIIPLIPEADIERGEYYTLPDNLEKEKQMIIADIVSEG